MPGERERILRRLTWRDEHHLRVGNTSFFLAVDSETAATTESTPEEFLLLKTQPMVQKLIEQFPDRIDHMVEIGIFKGGSIALYEELYSPKRLVGLDIKTDRVAALDKYLERRSGRDRVRLYYGADQQDRDVLDAIIRENFANEPLDLVVDDGSHRYGPTKAALSRFLPLLRPRGVYLIEDWGWAHWVRHGPDSDQFDCEYNPLTKLVFEAVMLTASEPGLLREVIITPSNAFLIRGDDDVEFDNGFDISQAYRTSIWSKFELAQQDCVHDSLSKREFLDMEYREPAKGGSPEGFPKIAPIDVWRSWVPLSIRKRVPPKLGAWAQEHLPQ